MHEFDLMNTRSSSDNGVDGDRLFRVVLFSESQVRLMERTGDGPTSWRLPHEDSPVRLVVARDVLSSDEVPRHLGLQYVVEVSAPDIEEAAEHAHQFAESAAIMLSAAGRSPVGRVHVRVAYEITPNVAERDFRQWYWDIPLPEGKRPVATKAFEALRTRTDELKSPEDERVLWRTVMSLSWFRQAAQESDALFRFLKLWIAFEALEPVLSAHYGIEDTAGFQGLRALAEDAKIGTSNAGKGSEFISTVLGLRRDIFHARRARGDDLHATADSILKPLEAALARAWEILLQIETGTLPDESVIPHRLNLKIFARLLHEDASTWSDANHPALVLKTFDAKRVPGGDPRDLQFTVQSTHTVTGADGAVVTSMELRGPTGGTLRVEQPDATPIRDDPSP